MPEKLLDLPCEVETALDGDPLTTIRIGAYALVVNHDGIVWQGRKETSFSFSDFVRAMERSTKKSGGNGATRLK